MKPIVLLFTFLCGFAFNSKAITSASITSYSNASCACCNDGSATVSANDGSGSYSYSWSSGGTGSYEGGLSPGNYSVTVTDAADNSTAVASVTIGPPPAISAYGVPNPMCAGYSTSIPYSACGNFNSGNVFTAYISDPTGSFNSPLSIGTLSATASGYVPVTLPFSLSPGSNYRIRVDASDPYSTGTDNGSDITITSAVTTGEPPSNMCTGGPTYIPYTACATFNSDNVFTAYLSDASGSFASPLSIGTISATTSGYIIAVVPTNTPTASGYMVRVDASDPQITGDPYLYSLSVSPSSITTSAISGTPFCSGGHVSVPFSVACNFNNDNIFTAQLSDASGSFSSPVNLGTLAFTADQTIDGIIPPSTPTGAGYRIRVVGSSPAITGSDNGTNLTINLDPAAITTGTIPALCSGGMDIPFTTCGGFNSGNVFTAQLSDASGSFASPVNIGTLASPQAGTIHAQVPLNTPTGAHYRIRVVSSSPSLTGVDNGADLFIDGASSSHPWLWAETQGGSFYSGDIPNLEGDPSAIAADAFGNSYVVGSFDTQGSFGATDLVSNGGYDVYLLKLDSNGSVVWVKNFGGSGDDIGKAIAVDPSGNICITGYFESDTMVFGSVQLIHNGGATSAGASGNRTGRSTIFTAEFDPSGTLLWARKAGGNSTSGNYDNVPADRAYGITTDASGDVLITGSITSDVGIFDSITVTPTSYSGTYGRLFAAKYSSSGIIQWARITSISGYGRGTGIACDATGNVFVTGMFDGGPFTFGGNSLTTSAWDIFIGKYSPTGTELWGKLAGSPPDDAGRAIAVDKNGDAYITGWLQSSPGTFGNITLTSTTSWDMFLAKYNGPDGTALWAKRIGSGASADQGYGITTDNCSNVLLTGVISGKVDTVLFDTIMVTAPNYAQAFVAEYNSAGNALFAKTAGGPPNQNYNWTSGYSITTDSKSNILITGIFYDPTMDFDCISIPNNGVNGNIFVAKMYNTSGSADVNISGSLNLCEGDSTTLSASGSGNYQWSPPAGLNAVTGPSVTAKPDTTTFYHVTSNSGGCVATASALVRVSPKPLPLVYTTDSLLCSGDSSTVCTSVSYSAYLWNTGDTTSCIQAKVAGGYWVTVTNAGCPGVSDHQEISFYPVPSVGITVLGDTLASFGATSYQWYLNNVLIPGANSAIYIATQSGDYSVQIVDVNGCSTVSNPVHVVINSVQNLFENDLFTIYPNPADEAINVKLNSEPVQGVLKIYNSLGQEIISVEARQEQTIEIKEFPSGIYYIAFQSPASTQTKIFSVARK